MRAGQCKGKTQSKHAPQVYTGKSCQDSFRFEREHQDIVFMQEPANKNKSVENQIKALTGDGAGVGAEINYYL